MAELLIFFPFGILTFCIDPSHMGFIWMFLPHIYRAITGLVILRIMPTTHDMVSEI